MTEGKTAALTVVGAKAGAGENAAARPAARPDPSHRPAEMPASVHPEDRPSTVAPLDRLTHAAIGRATFGLSPAALAAAAMDWAVHLALSPGKQTELVNKAYRKWLRHSAHAFRCLAGQSPEPCIAPLPQDKRFAAPAWAEPPFNLIYQGFLLQQQWWYNATTGVRGVSERNQRIVEFAARQLLDIFSPSNFLLTNPELVSATLANGGDNLRRGFVNLVEDAERIALGGKPPGSEAYRVGLNVAATPGRVIHRNRLVELIQYEPATPQVHAEPVLIVPAWIMKYYILDLSPHNSLVKHLVDQGHTVFMLSWKNPDADDRDFGMEDYLRLGIRDSLAAIGKILPGRRVHGVGYCLGGTLLTIAAAAMARDGDDRLKSLTLLAAQTDFTEAGELTLFINESQITFLEDIMWEQGYLDTKQMAGAFQLLRSNDLVWSRMIRDYLLGQRQAMTDLMAWNADSTRLPYRMHSEYLRDLFLRNDLVEGRYRVDERPVALNDIRVPIFAVGTERDHVAPWKSVYKINLLTDTDVTFVLTAGGHNAGIVSEPGHPGRRYQMALHAAHDRFIDAETWTAERGWNDGSWWPAWQNWLAEHSTGRIPPPPMGVPGNGSGGMAGVERPDFGPAPGRYVMAP